MYKLRYDAQIESVWDSLTGEARHELDEALLKVCLDPYRTTEEHPEDGPVKRLLVLQHTVITVLVIALPFERVYIRTLDPL
ncbi:hypothetical protein NX801_16270 [Streptomyces sp. LP05-1]|uniref:Uncharacterized protein n=1 Tax=Streptomyces pyxinae TaxID=2970734 RepID=A0ABT2CKV9_9ACTN|nr:hypothetical protein [Streptomyces sp. LP05-1]MCS0637189.1 hypothetical protein [Streptomyces sp. LP05-1]